MEVDGMRHDPRKNHAPLQTGIVLPGQQSKHLGIKGLEHRFILHLWGRLWAQSMILSRVSPFKRFRFKTDCDASLSSCMSKARIQV